MADPTPEQKFDAFRESTLHNLIQVACVELVKTIFTEADSVPNHAERIAWAKDAATFTGSYAKADQFQCAVVELKLIDPKVLASDITMDDVRAAVTTLVNKFAV